MVRVRGKGRINGRGLGKDSPTYRTFTFSFTKQQQKNETPPREKKKKPASPNESSEIFSGGTTTGLSRFSIYAVDSM